MHKEQLHDSKIDVAVLLVFFARPTCFEKVFAEVKKARPSKLFLYQDGPREGNEADIIGIKKCREIAEDIDWKCEVHKFYQEKNVGCDPSGFTAHRWAFSNVDKCIVLEDDVVPTQSFFVFCKELLDKYEDDKRINMICGMNNLEKWDCPESYFFSTSGSIWGWASWSRVVNLWDGNYSILEDDYYYQKFLLSMKNKNLDEKTFDRTIKWHAGTGKEYFESIFATAQHTNNGVNIIPQKNMILNIGNTPEGGTHSSEGIELIPTKLRKIFTMNKYEIDYPLKHPKYIIDDVEYTVELNKLMGYGNPFVKYIRKVEYGYLLLKHKGLGAFISKIFKKIGKK